jgi:hypothetical protein
MIFKIRSGPDFSGIFHIITAPARAAPACATTREERLAPSSRALFSPAAPFPGTRLWMGCTPLKTHHFQARIFP